jgi:serine/threonine-protein kinase RsbW
METRTFPGNYKSLAKIGEFVLRAAQKAGLDGNDSYAIELAVDEGCCNIIDHAYGGEDRGEIRCSIETGDGKIMVTLRDHGRPFDPSLVPEPALNVPIQKVRKRGAGVFLMKKLVDELHYETSPETGNKLVLVKQK